MKRSTELAYGLYQFGPFCLDAGERVLLRDGRVVPLPAKALSTLLALVLSRGHLVEKDVLMKEVWPEEFVEEGNLAQNIFMLRRALGETTENPMYIETVPRRGYRFVAPVSQAREEDPELAGNASERIALGRDANELLADMKSIAVLPFKTLGGETDDEYLGIGIADALITKLSHLKRVTVRPTSAVRNVLKDDPVSAGRELKVTTVLEGTLQKMDEHVRVTVQLVRVRDGATLWAESFDEKFTSIFAIEDSISEQVARALAVKLTTEEQTQLAKRYTENARAHQAYLRGRYFFEKRTQEGITKGIEYFESAIRIDPQYAIAYAGLSDCYSTLGAFDVLSPQESIPKAKEAALKALSIEPHLAEAHAALGRSLMFDWDWLGAEKEFQLAIDLNPNYATARHFYAIYLRSMRRFDESLAESKKAEELDPTSAGRKATIGGILYCARHYDQALEELCQALELDSNNAVAHLYLVRTYVQKAMYEEATAEYQKTTNLLGNNIELTAYLGHLYAVSGRKEAAQKVLAELEALSNGKYVSSCYRAYIHIGLDEKEQAFEWLEKAFQAHDVNLCTLGVELILDSLREDPRFMRLLQRTGLLPHLQNRAGGPVTGAEIETDEHANAINSLAILPFSNASNDPNMEYLSDGITESIIDSLSHLPQLKVMARSTVFHYKGIGLDPKEIGRSLGVGAIMMGRVQRLGEHLVVSAELVDAKDGSRLWGDRYRRKSSDIFSVQEELASEISDKLRLGLSGEQKERLTKRFTEDSEAYESYLRGRYSWNKRTPEELKRGVEYFLQAIAKDGSYSLAYAGLADCFILLGKTDTESSALVMPQAKVAAMKAIELDKTLGEAYASLAQIRFYYDWDWTEAARNYQQAVRLSPTYPTAHQWYGEYLLAMGRTDEGLAELKRARDLDPLSLIINTDLGLAFYWAQRYDLAIEQLERTIELEPSFFRAHLHLGMAYERKRMYGEAIAELETARRLNENAWTLAGLGYAFASFGEKAEAEKLLEQLLELSQARYVSSAAIAVVYAGFGDQVNQTLEWLEKAYSERSGLLAWINVWPIFDRIRSDGRFADLLRRIGFPSCPATGTQEQPIVVPADAPRRVFISSAAAIGDNGKPTVEFGGPFYEPTHNVKSNGILEVRDEIASGASARLVVESTGAREAQAAEGYTENSAAYRSYLKGRYYWSKYTQPALHKAIDCFREAVGLDPGYALAYVGMADSYTRLATSYISPAEGVPRAKAALSRALQINDNLAEAHATLGKLKMDYDWDWDGAEQEFRRAFQLKPDYATAHLWYGTYLESIGRLDDALIEKKRALELDPLSSHINVSLGSTLWLMHQWDEALETSRETIEMDDNFVPAHLLSGVANELSRNFPRSVANLEKACEIDHSPIILAGLGRAYSVAGRGEKAKAIIKKLQAQSRRGYVSPYSIALIMSGLGAIDTALDWLQKAYEGHDEWLFWLRVDPRLDQLRSYDRFKDLEGRVFGSQLHSRDNSVF